MPLHYAKAPGKIILFGEHAVVYGFPAIAIPLSQIEATVRIIPEPAGEQGVICVNAPQINLHETLSNLPENHPVAAAIWLALKEAQIKQIPAITVQITSTIPISAGLGSSAAVSVAIIRAVTGFFGCELTNEKISNLAFNVEKIQHGTPSGVDNNVIAYIKPVFYQAGYPIEFLQIEQPTHWVIADTGQKASTKESVADVRKLFEANQQGITNIFTAIGKISEQARHELIYGNMSQLGALMNENQRRLEQLNISSPLLDSLIQIARNTGAIGAKLSGGGRGGNMISLVPPENIEQVTTALIAGGAKYVFSTVLFTG